METESITDNARVFFTLLKVKFSAFSLLQFLITLTEVSTRHVLR
jgi:hypothetical protein